MKVCILMVGTLILTLAPTAGRANAGLLPTFQTVHLSFQGNVDAFTQSDIYQRALERESQNLNLEKLSKSNSTDEVRFWVGFGLITPRLFVLKREGGIDKATYYSIEPNPDKTAQPRSGVKVVLSLESPKSGWKDFRAFLKSNGVDASLKLTSDSEGVVDPDSETIVIEARSARGYKMVFFPKNSKSADGQKALAVCHKIESEFSVRMGC